MVEKGSLFAVVGVASFFAPRDHVAAGVGAGWGLSFQQSYLLPDLP
jgi:hypothetical protein